MDNKYKKLFNENMNSGELRRIYLSVGRTLDKSKRKELYDAYRPISSKVTRKELEEAAEQGVMTSY